MVKLIQILRMHNILQLSDIISVYSLIIWPRLRDRHANPSNEEFSIERCWNLRVSPAGVVLSWLGGSEKCYRKIIDDRQSGHAICTPERHKLMIAWEMHDIHVYAHRGILIVSVSHMQYSLLCGGRKFNYHTRNIGWINARVNDNRSCSLI